MVFSAQTLIRDLESIGFLDVILPFLLFFTILFAVLQKTAILGEKKGDTGKKYNVVIAFVISMLVVIPHVLWGMADRTDGVLRIGSRSFPDAVEVVNNSLPSISIWIIAILMFMLILGLFGANIRILQMPVSAWVAGLAIIIVGYIFGNAAGWWGNQYSNRWIASLGLNNPNNLFGIILILVFAVVLWLIVKEPPTAGTPAKPNPLKATLDEWWKP